MLRVSYELGSALEDDDVLAAREVHRERRVLLQVAHPTSIGRPAEAERPLHPYAVDGAGVWKALGGRGRQPVVRSIPEALFDVLPREGFVPSSAALAVVRRELGSCHRRRLVAHQTALLAARSLLHAQYRRSSRAPVGNRFRSASCRRIASPNVSKFSAGHRGGEGGRRALPHACCPRTGTARSCPTAGSWPRSHSAP